MDCAGLRGDIIPLLPDQPLKEFLESLHLHRPVEVLPSVAAHLLRVVGVGIDLLRKRQDLLNVDGALVGGNMENIGEIRGEVRIRLSHK